MAAYDGGDLEAALERLSYYVQQKKDEIEVVDALLKFADARRRVPLPAGRHLIEATGLYQHARRLLTDHPGVAQRERRLIETDRRLLALYGAQGMGAELVDTAARLLERAPGDREALAALAQVRCEQREFAGAGTCIDRLIALEPEDLESVSYTHLRAHET